MTVHLQYLTAPCTPATPIGLSSDCLPAGCGSSLSPLRSLASAGPTPGCLRCTCPAALAWPPSPTSSSSGGPHSTVPGLRRMPPSHLWKCVRRSARACVRHDLHHSCISIRSHVNRTMRISGGGMSSACPGHLNLIPLNL